MLLPLIVNRSIGACVLCSGFATILFYNLPNKLGLIIAALFGVAAGIIVERWSPAQPAVAEEQNGALPYQEANKP
jgi:hypothetical protein